MSTPPNSEDQAILAYIAVQKIYDAIGLVCETGFWAIYLVLFFLGLSIQISRGIQTKRSIVLLLALLILFMSSTTLWATNVAVFMLSLQVFFIKFPQLSWDDRFDVVNRDLTIKFAIPQEALFLLNMIIGDSVVIWRAWKICQNGTLQKFVHVPILLLSASFAFSIIDVKCLAVGGFSSESSVAAGGRICQNAELIAWAISLGTNFVSTSIIAIRAWQHHTAVRALLGPLPRRKSRAEKMLIILVESGFVYCLFWLSQIVLFLPNIFNSVSGNLAWSILGGVGDQISGIYPTLIIVLVNLQRSMADDLEISTGKTLTALQFASGQTPTNNNVSSRREDENPENKGSVGYRREKE